MRLWIGLVGVAVALGVIAAAPQVARADEVVVKEAEDKGVKGLRASFTVEQERAVVFAVLNDLDAFLKLFPEIKSFKVVREEGESRDIHFKVDAVLAEAEYTLRRTTRRGAQVDAISWNRLSGDANVIRGAWILTDGPRPGTTKVDYQSYVDVSAVVPTALVRDVAMDKVQQMVKRLRDACDARAAR